MRRGFKELKDREWLHNKYIVEEKNSYEIAEILGCAQTSVYRALKKIGIKRRQRR